MPLFEQDSTIGLQENPCSCLNLSWESRMYCFIGSFISGLIMGVVALLNLWLLKITSFAILYTFCNIFLLFSSLFLVGPMRQLKMLTAKTRLVAFSVYIITLILTLIIAIKTQKFLPTLILVIIQFFAIFWYCASFVPFARRFITNAFGSLV